MLPLSYSHINYVDSLTVLQCQSLVNHRPQVRLQNVVCADHKKLIKGKKRLLMMTIKHATV